ncbi:hypothetical protein NUU61_003622 [Penicillium alfredii]|uniref:Uncharacterized protein n=1 Tax=Penicillium alfredii TaxID=1506179 RepID=A0A9W9KCI7_9EURO|nr:uncharacterized protein NUU61_003622 [Penicillium alfredii]KAJ5101400.1 hypothetical protein NUU61_003622 [Penicillium alfredii]
MWGKKFIFCDEKCEVVRCGSHEICQFRLTDLYLAEHALREVAQREEKLHRRVLALQKTMAIESTATQCTATESVSAQLEQANQQLQEAQEQYPRQEYTLYQALFKA